MNLPQQPAAHGESLPADLEEKLREALDRFRVDVHLIQAHAAGKIDRLTDIRDIVRRSFEARRFAPAISAAP